MPTKTSDQRSRIMAAVKGKDTSPEVMVRRLLRSLGFRFALHRRDLPGVPDIVLNRRRTAIFVNGCFWHGHDCARGARVPKTNRAYWQAKIARNVARDRATRKLLRKSGWRSIVVWECALRDEARVKQRLQRLLAKISTTAKMDREGTLTVTSRGGRGKIVAPSKARPMSEAAIEAAAKADSDNPPLTKAALAKLSAVPRIRTLRRALSLTQEEFAARYRIPLGTLRDWEQGRSQPDQPTRAYLAVIARDPEGVRAALRRKRG